jgi:hypothetical protein
MMGSVFLSLNEQIAPRAAPNENELSICVDFLNRNGLAQTLAVLQSELGISKKHKRTLFENLTQ